MTREKIITILLAHVGKRITITYEGKLFEVLCPEAFDFPVESRAGTFLVFGKVEQKFLIDSISSIRLTRR